MSRRYEELVEVRVGPAGEHGVRLEGGVSGGGAPEETLEVPTLFLWRGRVHLVRAVLSQWSQRVPWWRCVDVAEGDEGLERRVWRVEAGAGRASGTGVYDLVEGERWWLDRVAD